MRNRWQPEIFACENFTVESSFFLINHEHFKDTNKGESGNALKWKFLNLNRRIYLSLLLLPFNFARNHEIVLQFICPLCITTSLSKYWIFLVKNLSDPTQHDFTTILHPEEHNHVRFSSLLYLLLLYCYLPHVLESRWFGCISSVWCWPTFVFSDEPLCPTSNDGEGVNLEIVLSFAEVNVSCAI